MWARWLLWTSLAVIVLGALLTLWRTHWAEARFPALGQFFELPQVRLHYTDQNRASGNGTLVLLHGASTNLRDFHTLSLALGVHQRVISIDRPGSGYSTQKSRAWLDPAAQAAAIMELLQALGITESVWVGHSLAGSIVMAGLLNHPERVRGGVLIAGAAYPWNDGVDFINHLPGYMIVGPLVSHTLIAPLGHLRLDGGLSQAFAPEIVLDGYRDTTGIDLYLRPAQFAATGRDVRLLSDYLTEQSKRYTQITQPMLLIHGDSDDIVPAWNHADRLIELLPQARYHRIAGGGHQPHHVHAAQVAAWIREFAAEHAETPAIEP